MNYETIKITKEGAVDWLLLNRPDHLNSINLKMVDELRDYFGNLQEDGSVRIVVMSGAGKAFCAGLDIKDAAERRKRNEPGPFGGGMGFQNYLADVYVRMRRCPQPIISLVHGPACGGGFSFVMASDIRIAGTSARMNAAYIKLGLTACDMGASYFLPRLVGTSIASELMLTGRFIHAPRALACGLVSEVVPDEQLRETARSYVADMLRASPMGLRLTKDGLNVAIDAGSLEAAIAIENRNQTLCARTADFAEGMRAFIEKREPVYTGT